MRNQIIGLLAAGLAVALAGCGDVETTGVLALTQVSSMKIEKDGCGVTDKTLVPPLFYDAGIGALMHSEYRLGLWLRNSLEANDDTDGTSLGRINTNRIQVQRIEVKFTDRENWGFLPESMDVGMPFMVDTGAEIGWPTELLPVEVAMLLIEHPDSPIAEYPSGPARLPIRIRAVGELLDGTSVKSNEFGLTLSVCNGCLAACTYGYESLCAYAQPDLFDCADGEEETE